MALQETVGVIGGTGALGGAIGRRLLQEATVAPERLWLSSRSGGRQGFEPWPGVNVTTDSQTLVDACDIVLLSVPPQQAATLKINAGDRLVVSVMAGVTIAGLRKLTGASRIIRAMSSPAAELAAVIPTVPQRA